jgi:hypothetical protein
MGFAAAALRVARRYPISIPARRPSRNPETATSAANKGGGRSEGQLSTKLLPTFIGAPPNAGTRAPRNLPAMHPPTAEPANGG